MQTGFQSSGGGGRGSERKSRLTDELRQIGSLKCWAGATTRLRVWVSRFKGLRIKGLRVKGLGVKGLGFRGLGVLGLRV